MGKRSKNKEAVYERHWAMRPNLQGHKSQGNGYACLILNDTTCTVYTKHSSLAKHMLDKHGLIPGKPPRGRPSTSDRVRKPMSTNAATKQADGFLGYFPLRVWQLKKNYMLKALKWAQNAHAIARPEGNRWKWLVKKAEEVYKRWRAGPEFTSALKKTMHTVSEYWDKANDERDLALDKSAITAKVLSLVVMLFACQFFNWDTFVAGKIF